MQDIKSPYFGENSPYRKQNNKTSHIHKCVILQYNDSNQQYVNKK